MQSILHNPRHLAERRQLRHKQTKAERVLWQELRDRRLGYKFRRQVSIGPFVVDFYCYESSLVIELDGPIHGEQKEYDLRRQKFLEKQGLQVLRYRNDQVLFEREAVLQDIVRVATLRESTSPQPSSTDLTPNPSPKREGSRVLPPSPLGERVRSINILYEDNHLIAVYKPAGMLVQGDHSGDPTLMDEVKYFIKQRDGKSGNVFLGMVHRLDRPVSGIVLFAKTSKGAARLSEQFRKHTIEKIYHALVIGVPKEKTARLVHYLKKDPDKNVVHAYDHPVEGAREAVLEYEVFDTAPPLLLGEGEGEVHDRKAVFGVSLLKIRLETGRPHQIRAQLAATGYPIVGDVKYGGRLRPLDDADQAKQQHPTIALCATEITFFTATTNQRKTVRIDVPHWQ